MKVFFVKYNDPIYVKMEKLDIMIRLSQQSNIAQVLSELKEYAAEVDVDFVFVFWNCFLKNSKFLLVEKLLEQLVVVQLK